MIKKNTLPIQIISVNSNGAISCSVKVLNFNMEPKSYLHLGTVACISIYTTKCFFA